MSELEEIEREDNFRLKRFKEFKTKKSKGKDDMNHHCFCDNKPGKGDDFVCAVCQQEEENRKKSKKSTQEFKTQPCIPEEIGDKASTISAAKKKCLDDLTEHLQKVISLTSQCKTKGLVSPSVDTFIYTCKEIRCKLKEIDHTCMINDEQNTSSEGDNVPCEVCTKPDEIHTETCQTSSKVYSNEVQTIDEESLGCFETKYKETVKTIKFRNKDGTISEEKQVITVKTERKHPYKLGTALGGHSSCKIKAIDSLTSRESRFNNKVKENKSECINNCMQKEHTKIRACVSDFEKKGRAETNDLLEPEYCKVCDTAANPKTPSTASYVYSPKKSPSAVESNKSEVSVKSSYTSKRIADNIQSKKNVSCECRVETKSVCSDAIWKDVACSTTGLAESSEEREELCICIKESDMEVPTKLGDKAPSGEKSNTNSVELCCDKKHVTRELSHTCSPKLSKNNSKLSADTKSKESNSKKDVSTTTSKRELGDNSNMIKEKPIKVESHSCVMPTNESKENDTKSMPCCKIRIISKQDDGSESEEKQIQEVIFFGSILDAIKKILVPSNSEESIRMKSKNVKGTDGKIWKSCSCSSKNSLSKKLSVKSSICKTCETGSQVTSDGIASSTYVSCKGIERSQSCPQCNTKTEKKSITWSRQRSQSDENTCHHKTQNKVSSKSVCCDNKSRERDFISKCSLCGSELLSKATKSDTTSITESLSRNPSVTDIDSCISCREDGKSCSSIWKNAENLTINSNKHNIEDDSCVCPSSEKSDQDIPQKSLTKTVKPSASKICQTEKPYHKQDNDQKNSQKNLKIGQPCSMCSKQDPKSSNLQHNRNKSEHKYCKVPNAQSLCCGYTPRSSRELTEPPQDSVEEVVMKDAATSTRRSDRYDVRPLKMIRSQRKITCTCRSDSYLTEGIRPRALKRSRSCSSCHGDYFR